MDNCYAITHKPTFTTTATILTYFLKL